MLNPEHLIGTAIILIVGLSLLNLFTYVVCPKLSHWKGGIRLGRFFEDPEAWGGIVAVLAIIGLFGGIGSVYIFYVCFGLAWIIYVMGDYSCSRLE